MLSWEERMSAFPGDSAMAALAGASPDWLAAYRIAFRTNYDYHFSYWGPPDPNPDYLQWHNHLESLTYLGMKFSEPYLLGSHSPPPDGWAEGAEAGRLAANKDRYGG